MFPGPPHVRPITVPDPNLGPGWAGTAISSPVKVPALAGWLTGWTLLTNIEIVSSLGLPSCRDSVWAGLQPGLVTLRVASIKTLRLFLELKHASRERK